VRFFPRKSARVENFNLTCAETAFGREALCVFFKNHRAALFADFLLSFSLDPLTPLMRGAEFDKNAVACRGECNVLSNNNVVPCNLAASFFL